MAIDADTKLVPCWMIGERNMPDAVAFLTDLSERMRNRIQLTTDGRRMYAKAVPGVHQYSHPPAPGPKLLSAAAVEVR